MHSSTTILVAILALTAVSEAVRRRITTTREPVACSGEGSMCWPDPNSPYLYGKCCNGTCIAGGEARCPGERSCKRDADCPRGQCCDISTFAITTGHCSSDQKQCRTSCQVQSDCRRGMCCSLGAKFGRYGICGSQATMFCSCDSDDQCNGPFKCQPYSAQSDDKECM